MAFGLVILKIRCERCSMTKRIIVSLAAIGLLLPLAASAQKLRPVQQLTVYDADGNRVGVIIGAETEYDAFHPLVPFKVDDVPFMLSVFRDGFAAQEVVVWESTDCSGAPFIPIGTPDYPITRSSLPIVALGVPGSTVYVEDGAVTTIGVRSYSTMPINAPRNVPPLPTRCAAPGIVPWIRQVVPARALIDMNTLFKPPFTVR